MEVFLEPGQQAAFRSKYVEGALLGKGGYASVFAGYCQHDNLPVAIKHIQGDTRCLAMTLDAKNRRVPMEVALMLKLRSAGGPSGAVALLDWYDLRDGRVSCMNLSDYMDSRDCDLQECEVEDIINPLVVVLIEILAKGVFHRDIKLENILCETRADVVQRIRIIDFGSGTFVTEGVHGTSLYSCPEGFLCCYYRPEPTTVWQLGVVLYMLLHDDFPFHDMAEIILYDVCVRDDVPDDCRDLLMSCLNKNPDPAWRP